MSKHAYLSASASHRWLNCPPSAKLNAEAENTTSEYARQGTDCHELCAYLVEKALGRDVEDPTEHLDYYDSEMQQCAEEYRNFVLEQIERAKGFCGDPQVMIEQRLDFSRWVKDGFGTGDCVIVADEELQIIDYKHGVGVLVDADHNSQMMCYALGAIEAFDGIYDIDHIQMTIFQPRRENVSTWVTTKEEVITGPKTRWSYVNVFEPKAISEGNTPKYSISLIIPKSDTKTLQKIRAAIQAAYEEGQSKLKGNGKSVPALSALKTPLRDGDLERPDDEAYQNSFFLNANSTNRPGIVDADRNPILERSEIYSGVYGRASINFYAFNTNGNKGIACGLNNLQKISDGDPLGGMTRAADDFDDDEDLGTDDGDDDFLD